MTATEFAKQLLQNPEWKEMYLEWSRLSPITKSFELFTAMCIGKAANWFGSLLTSERHQWEQVKWVAGALIKKLKEDA